jgi:hypothetical protein
MVILLQSLLLIIFTTTTIHATRLRTGNPTRRPRLECQNLCHIHCKNNYAYLTNCIQEKSTSWSCLSGCAVACNDDPASSPDVGKYEECRDTCVTNFQLRCDIAGCKAGCRRGSTHRYQFDDNDEEVNAASDTIPESAEDKKEEEKVKKETDTDTAESEAAATPPKEEIATPPKEETTTPKTEESFQEPKQERGSADFMAGDVKVL